MKRVGLILLACLMLALPTVAQAPEKAVPDDLVVTAEIIGHSYKSAPIPESKSQLILYVRLDVRNQTNHPREITFYSCGWESSWIQRGAVGFDVWGCDKNYLSTRPIPARQSIIFYGPVRVRMDGDRPTSFALGFVDFNEADFEHKVFHRKFKKKRWDKFLESKVVYWSNELNSHIAPTATPEITGSGQYPRYSLPEDEK